MSSMVDRAGLAVADVLADFIETQALPGSGLAAGDFWRGVGGIMARFSPENRQLLAVRDDLQARIDEWHEQRRGQPVDGAAYRAFLTGIGYLVPEPPAFRVDPENVDDEVVAAGPQLVVPVLNARFALNAANARWGSLYDALYGTDAIAPPAAAEQDYDPARGAKVIGYAKEFLDRAVPLARGRYADVSGWSVADGALSPALADPSQFVGYRGQPATPQAVLLRHHGLHIELLLDRKHPVGKSDPAGLADVMMEAALTTIIDFEDSIAAVDAADKTAAYANWLGLMKGELQASFAKGGHSLTRRLEPDRSYVSPRGRPFELPGRSLLFVRNVGHLMTTPAVRLPDGSQAPEGILDAVLTSLIALHDRGGRNRLRNSRKGSIYIVKPKMHGPAEADFTNRLFDAVEDLLDLPRHTIKVGVMDEERRTSANLAAVIAAVRHRIVFINTGFLDRTGDEIHTSMHAGAVVPKGEMRNQAWIKAYEARNVAIGLACGIDGHGQIGKGMWTAPDRMADMLAQKIAHPQAGANTAWVPSPTAATLHALHYHQVDVRARQHELRGEAAPALEQLLTLPLAGVGSLAGELIQRELDNNAQSILGYVVRWIDQGVGCSKVPDINDVGLMEDRATLRISAQHLANWLMHGVCTRADLEQALRRMAAKVDRQNAGDPAYRTMAPGFEAGLAFQAACALIFEGASEPNGYTEPLLHSFRLQAKSRLV
ncbi:MAG TPA: malate synthase G [Steroidobacteraceae bacterium]|nr:malate synthase G [Steroidobacteraceae bacterium]